MKYYYMSEYFDIGNNAGSKARNDLEKIFEEIELIKIGCTLPVRLKHDLKFYFDAIVSALNVKRSLGKIKNSTIIFKYPISKGAILKKKIQKISKKNNVVFFIHDIDYLRAEDKNIAEEINLLNCAKALVCHNEKMIGKLKEDGVNVDHFINLELFDYLLEDKIITEHAFGNDIVYAGNLKKGGFIDKLSKCNFDFTLHLYGMNYERIEHEKILYEGCVKPEELVQKLNYSYGLVWDSLDYKTCTGKLGEYTQYNNPHKLSLYIAAKLPVIVWSKSASAEFVSKYKIGVTVDSLLDIDKVLSNVTEKEYSIFLNNLDDLQKKVTSGYYAKNAVNEIKQIFDKKNY